MPRHLITDRLELRLFEAGDAAVLATHLSECETCKWLSRVPFPYSHADARSYADARCHIDRVIRSNDNTLAIVRQGTLIGSVSIGAMLGYWIARSKRGMGFASKACRTMIKSHFQDGADILKSGHHIGNAASRNVLTKLGFKNTNVRSVFASARNTVVDLQGMTLSQSGWRRIECP